MSIDLNALAYCYRNAYPACVHLVVLDDGDGPSYGSFRDGRIRAADGGHHSDGLCRTLALGLSLSRRQDPACRGCPLCGASEIRLKRHSIIML